MSGNPTDGFFTRGTGFVDFLGIGPEEYDLPQSLAKPVVLVVHQVLIAAFKILRSRSHDIGGAIEDQVTLWLLNVIENDLRKNATVRGFNSRTFDKVTRQQEVENYDGTKIRKTPDLVFTPRQGTGPHRILSTHFGLFVECKPVGPDHPVTSAYCDAGLCRFVNGDYAWAMTEGMMVGYARRGRTIEKNLQPVFAAGRASLQLASQLTAVSSPSARAGPKHEALQFSEHHRRFPWPHGKGVACRIKVYHSWHHC
jgi:hypothetical protein